MWFAVKKVVEKNKMLHQMGSFFYLCSADNERQERN